jgi:adenine C2-methylase RlmN of 23S rRNA A2503 and tRNA A37
MRTPTTARPTHHDRIVTNVVFMGMGEPLLNYEPYAGRAADHARRSRLRPVATARDVSTSGVVPMIDRLREDQPSRSRCRCTHRTMRCAIGWCR